MRVKAVKIFFTPKEYIMEIIALEITVNVSVIRSVLSIKRSLGNWA